MPIADLGRGLMTWKDVEETYRRTGTKFEKAASAWDKVPEAWLDGGFLGLVLAVLSVEIAVAVYAIGHFFFGVW
jgi:hypothetical protein